MKRLNGIVVLNDLSIPPMGMNKSLQLSAAALNMHDVNIRFVKLNNVMNLLGLFLLLVNQALFKRTLKTDFVIFNSIASLNNQNRFGLLAGRLFLLFRVTTYVYWHETKYVFDAEEHKDPKRIRGIDRFSRHSDVIHLAASGRCAEYVRMRYQSPPLRILYECAATPEYETPLKFLPSSPPVVCNVASVQDRKGPDLFFAIATKVCSQHPTVEFIWVGGGRDLGLWQERVGQSEYNDRIRFVGHSEPGYDVLSDASLMLLTSKDDPFPLAVLEAMSLARSIVVFDVGGAPEALGGCGDILRPFDIDLAVNVIMKKLSLPSEQLICPTALERYQDHYTPERFAARLSCVLRQRI